MDAVLLFSGQGAQKVGMGKDLYDQYPVAKALIEQADKALGESLSAVMFEGPGEELTRTCNCQPALFKRNDVTGSFFSGYAGCDALRHVT